MTLTRCDWKPKSCRDESDTTTKMVHPGQCGNCTEGNVCPAMVGRMRRWRQCDFSSRCEFLIARCEQFKNDGTVLVKRKDLLTSFNRLSPVLHTIVVVTTFIRVTRISYKMEEEFEIREFVIRICSRCFLKIVPC